jgi:hypothetical protein
VVTGYFMLGSGRSVNTLVEKMGRTTALRRSIKAQFLPFMAEKGFRPDLRDMPSFTTFRKVANDKVYVCDIQWEKCGRPRFVLNFGSCGPHGVICHGKEVDPTDVTPSNASDSGRLTAKPGPWVSCWFRQDRPLLQRITSPRLRPSDEVIAELIRLFSEVEEYWSLGNVGRHVRLFARHWSADRLMQKP